MTIRSEKRDGTTARLRSVEKSVDKLEKVLAGELLNE